MAPGSNPKHTIYAFFQFVLLKLYWENDENKQKEAGTGPFKKNCESIFFSGKNFRNPIDQMLWPFSREQENSLSRDVVVVVVDRK